MSHQDLLRKLTVCHFWWSTWMMCLGPLLQVWQASLNSHVPNKACSTWHPLKLILAVPTMFPNHSLPNLPPLSLPSVSGTPHISHQIPSLHHQHMSTFMTTVSIGLLGLCSGLQGNLYFCPWPIMLYSWSNCQGNSSQRLVMSFLPLLTWPQLFIKITSLQRFRSKKLHKLTIKLICFQ